MTRRKPRVPKSLFSKGLDEVATRFLKNVAPADERMIQRLTALEGLGAMEALVFAPRVSFKVYGENVVLAVLVNAMGACAVEDLLREGGVEFVLWRSFPVQWEGAAIPAGLIPLAGMTLTSKAHSDPLESAMLGLRGWARDLPDQDAKRLAKLAAGRTAVVAEDLGNKAVRRLLRAYEDGLLASRGFDPDVPIAQVSAEGRTRLASLANDLTEAVVAFEGDYDLHEGATTWATLVDACARVPLQDKIIQSAESTLDLERLPSIPDLLLKQVISHTEIVAIRQRSETEEFRKWLWSQPDPSDCTAVSEAYLAAMAPKANLKDNRLFKAARISAVGIVGSILGTVIGGALLGDAATVAGVAVGVAVSQIDGFWGDKLLAGTNPRRLATDVLAPRVASHAAHERSTATVQVAATPVAPAPQTDTRAQRNRRKARRRAERESRRKNRG